MASPTRWTVMNSVQTPFGWTLGVGDGQGGLACCGPWDCKESDMTEQLNWPELKTYVIYICNTKPRQCIKKQRHHFANKGPYSQSYGFSSNVQMWELGHKEGWVPKNWCFWTVVLEKTLESPLDIKEIQSINPKGNQPWIFIRRTEAEAPILWPPDVKIWLIGKDLDTRKDGRQKEKGVAEDEMVG